MTGEKRVVQVGVASIRVLLQAKLQRMALLPEAIGEGLAKPTAKRWQSRGGERCQCARCTDLGDQRHGRAPGCRASRPSVARLGGERRDLGIKSGDLAQHAGRLARARSLAAEDGERKGTSPPMRCRELAGQARVDV